MQNLKEPLKYQDISVTRYQLVKDAAHEKRMPDFLLWWLFSHCSAATLGCAHRGSCTPICPALGHSYPKPISRKLHRGRHCTKAGFAGDGKAGTTLLWEMRFSKAEAASPARSQCCSTSASAPHITLDLSPGSLSASFSASFKPVPALLSDSTCCMIFRVPHFTHSKSFWSLLLIILATCPKPKPEVSLWVASSLEFRYLRLLGWKNLQDIARALIIMVYKEFRDS